MSSESISLPERQWTNEIALSEHSASNSLNEPLLSTHQERERLDDRSSGKINADWEVESHVNKDEDLEEMSTSEPQRAHRNFPLLRPDASWMFAEPLHPEFICKKNRQSNAHLRPRPTYVDLTSSSTVCPEYLPAAVPQTSQACCMSCCIPRAHSNNKIRQAIGHGKIYDPRIRYRISRCTKPSFMSKRRRVSCCARCVHCRCCTWSCLCNGLPSTFDMVLEREAWSCVILLYSIATFLGLIIGSIILPSGSIIPFANYIGNPDIHLLAVPDLLAKRQLSIFISNKTASNFSVTKLFGPPQVTNISFYQTKTDHFVFSSSADDDILGRNDHRFVAYAVASIRHVCEQNYWETRRCHLLRQASLDGDHFLFWQGASFGHLMSSISSPGKAIAANISKIINADTSSLFFDDFGEDSAARVQVEALRALTSMFGVLFFPVLPSIGTSFRSFSSWVFLAIYVPISLIFMNEVTSFWYFLFANGPLSQPDCIDEKGAVFTNESIPLWHRNIPIVSGYGNCVNDHYFITFNILQSSIQGIIEAIFKGVGMERPQRFDNSSNCDSHEIVSRQTLSHFLTDLSHIAYKNQSIVNSTDINSVPLPQNFKVPSLYQIEESFAQRCEYNKHFGTYADVLLLRLWLLAALLFLYIVMPMCVVNKIFSRLRISDFEPPSAKLCRGAHTLATRLKRCLNRYLKSLWLRICNFCKSTIYFVLDRFPRLNSCLPHRFTIGGRMLRPCTICLQRFECCCHQCISKRDSFDVSWSQEAMMQRSALDEPAWKEVVRKGAFLPIRIKITLLVTSLILLWIWGRHCITFMWYENVRYEFNVWLKSQPSAKRIEWCPYLNKLLQQQPLVPFFEDLRASVDLVRSEVLDASDEWTMSRLSDESTAAMDSSLSSFMKANPVLEWAVNICCGVNSRAPASIESSNGTLGDCSVLFPKTGPLHTCIQECSDKVAFIKCVAKQSKSDFKAPDQLIGPCNLIPSQIAYINLDWWIEYDVGMYLHYAIVWGMNGAAFTVLMLYASRSYFLMRTTKQRCKAQAQSIATFFHPELGFPLSTEKAHGGVLEEDGGMPWSAILAINPEASLDEHPKKCLKYTEFEFAPALLGTHLFLSLIQAYVQFPLFLMLYIFVSFLIILPDFRVWLVTSLLLQYLPGLLVIISSFLLRRLLMEASAPKRIGILFPREFKWWDLLLTVAYLPLGGFYSVIRMSYSCLSCPCMMGRVEKEMVPLHQDMSYKAYVGTLNGARLRSEYECKVQWLIMRRNADSNDQDEDTNYD